MLTKRTVSCSGTGAWGGSSSRGRLEGGEWKHHGEPGAHSWPPWPRRKGTWMYVFVPSEAASEDGRSGGVVCESVDESVLEVRRYGYDGDSTDRAVWSV